MDTVSGFKFTAPRRLDSSFEISAGQHILARTLDRSKHCDISRLKLIGVQHPYFFLINQNSQDRICHKVHLVNDLV